MTNTYYNLSKHDDYSFDVYFAVKEKIKTMFLPFKKNEYGWIDSLLIKMASYLNFSSFLNKINWDSLQAQIRIERNTKKNNNEKT